MKKWRIALIAFALLLLVIPALAESSLTASINGGNLDIRWSALGDCILTIRRDGWPIRVCNVDGASGGISFWIGDADGDYQVTLRTSDGCLTANIQANLPEATKVPAKTVAPIQTPTPTQRPVPTQTPVPTLTPVPEQTPVPTKIPQTTASPAPTEIVIQRPSTTPGATVQFMTGLASQVVEEVNAERAKYGLSALTVSNELTNAAYIRAQEIVKLFSHTRPNGTKWSTVSSAAYAENIAKGHSSASRVMAAWMTSSGHRKNILHASYGSIGVCAIKVNGVIYWVQLFGK